MNEFKPIRNSFIRPHISIPIWWTVWKKVNEPVNNLVIIGVWEQIVDQVKDYE